MDAKRQILAIASELDSARATHATDLAAAGELHEAAATAHSAGQVAALQALSRQLAGVVAERVALRETAASSARRAHLAGVR